MRVIGVYRRCEGDMQAFQGEGYIGNSSLTTWNDKPPHLFKRTAASIGIFLDQL